MTISTPTITFSSKLEGMCVYTTLKFQCRTGQKNSQNDTEVIQKNEEEQVLPRMSKSAD